MSNLTPEEVERLRDALDALGGSGQRSKHADAVGRTIQGIVAIPLFLIVVLLFIALLREPSPPVVLEDPIQHTCSDVDVSVAAARHRWDPAC